MIQNLQDELYQLEKKQPKGVELGDTFLWLIVGGVKMQIWGGKSPKFIKLLQENDLKTPPYN